jgi:hypothetical protein
MVVIGGVLQTDGTPLEVSEVVEPLFELVETRVGALYQVGSPLFSGHLFCVRSALFTEFFHPNLVIWRSMDLQFASLAGEPILVRPDRSKASRRRYLRSILQKSIPA